LAKPYEFSADETPDKVRVWAKARYNGQKYGSFIKLDFDEPMEEAVKILKENLNDVLASLKVDDAANYYYDNISPDGGIDE